MEYWKEKLKVCFLVHIFDIIIMHAQTKHSETKKKKNRIYEKKAFKK